MNRAIEDLLESDSKSRWHILAWSAGITAVAGFSADAIGFCLSTASTVAVVAGVALASCLVLGYIRRSGYRQASTPEPQRRVLTPLLEISVATLAIYLLSVFVPSQLGPLVERRLDTASSRADASPTKLIQILRVATELRIPIHEGDVNQALSKIENAGYSNDWVTISSLIGPKLQSSIDSTVSSVVNSGPSGQSYDDKTFSEVSAKTAYLRKLKPKLATSEVDRTAALLKQAVSFHEDNPAAWQAAAQMISLRSEVRGEATLLPDCFEFQGDGGLNLRTPNPTMRYHDCALNLSDVSHLAAMTHFHLRDANGAEIEDGNIKPDITLTNGVVSYAGGPLIAADSLSLINCGFDIRPPEKVPPPSGRFLTEQLLVADLSNVSVKLSNATS